MAIVFISPQKRQKVFLWAISVLLVLVLAGISLLALLPEIQNRLTVVPAEGVFIMPDIKINFTIIDSQMVKNLEPFKTIKVEFSYVAIDQNGKEVSGKIVSDSKESAQHDLEAMGLKTSSLKEPSMGRDNPFVSYYKALVTPNVKK